MVASVIALVAVYDRCGSFLAPYSGVSAPIWSTLALAAVFLLDFTVLGIAPAAVFTALGVASMVNVPLDTYEAVRALPHRSGFIPRKADKDLRRFSREHREALDDYVQWSLGDMQGPNPLHRIPGIAEADAADAAREAEKASSVTK